MNKRYFWSKMPLNFFEKEDIKIIKQQNNGSDYVIFWQQLLFIGIKSEEIGVLRYKEKIPYSPEILATATSTNIDIVKGALTLFNKLEMLHISDNGDIILNESVHEMVGSETVYAKKKREYRKKLEEPETNQRQVEDNVSKIKDNVSIIEDNVSIIEDNVSNLSRQCPTELELELELELDKEILRDKISENFPEKKEIVDNSVDIWTSILSEMKKQINPASYQSWLRDTKFLQTDNNLIQVEVKDEVTNSHIINNYLEQLKEIAKSITGEEHEFEFIYFV